MINDLYIFHQLLNYKVIQYSVEKYEFKNLKTNQ